MSSVGRNTKRTTEAVTESLGRPHPLIPLQFFMAIPYLHISAVPSRTSGPGELCKKGVLQCLQHVDHTSNEGGRMPRVRAKDLSLFPELLPKVKKARTPSLEAENTSATLVFCVFVWGPTPGGTQNILMALCSGITPDRLWGPHRVLGVKLDLIHARRKPSALCYSLLF